MEWIGPGLEIEMIRAMASDRGSLGLWPRASERNIPLLCKG